ncbi:MAG: hypothetical protein HYW50_03425 [Candidatus Diapherotrites archaeon]|nr:hypothetical protein [Candidatus Diapherotrites archaeon]
MLSKSHNPLPDEVLPKNFVPSKSLHLQSSSESQNVSGPVSVAQPEKINTKNNKKNKIFIRISLPNAYLYHSPGLAKLMKISPKNR